MRRFCVLTLIVTLAVSFGCQKAAPVAEPVAERVPSVTGSRGSAGDPGIMPSAAGGLAPVTNPEAVDGAGGGGTGSVAKNMARNAANQASGTPPPDSADPTDGGQ